MVDAGMLDPRWLWLRLDRNGPPAFDRQGDARAVPVDDLRGGGTAHQGDVMARGEQLRSEERSVGRSHDQDLVGVRHGLLRNGRRASRSQALVASTAAAIINASNLPAFNPTGRRKGHDVNA